MRRRRFAVVVSLAVSLAVPAGCGLWACRAASALNALERECAAGDEAQCQRLVSALDDRCSAKETSACRRLAELQIAGRGGRASKARALQAYERGCQAGDASACADAAEGYLRREPSRAQQLWERACDGGEAGACMQLSSLLRQDQQGASAARGAAVFDRGVRLFEKACERGQAQGCFGLGNSLAIAPTPDETRAQKSLMRAAGLWQAACDANDARACYRLGVSYKDGAGVPADEARSLQLLRKGCDLGQAESCDELATEYRSNDRPEDDGEAVRLFEKACAAGCTTGFPCRQAAFLYLDGLGAPVDKKRAARLLEKCCGLEESWCCAKLGTMYGEGDGVSMDRDKAAELLRSSDGLEFRAVAVARSKRAVDPTLTAFGIPAASLDTTDAGPGKEFIVVGVEARRRDEASRLPVRKVWLLDAAGTRYENHSEGDADFGDRPLERRDYLFRVPEGLRPVKIRFELGAITLDLPPEGKS